MQANDDILVLLCAAAFALVWLVQKFFRLPSVRGWFGEARVNAAIRRKLGKADYIDIHDVTLPVPDGTTQIDHVIVSRFGIFVVETKNYSGWIYGGERQRNWTQTFKRQKHSFQNPLRQNYKHVKAVQAALGVRMGVIHSVIMFVGRSKFKTWMPANVSTLGGGIRYIRSFQLTVLSESQVAGYASTLRSAKLNSNRATRKLHLKNLKRKSGSPICPRCGKRMVLREAKKGRNVGRNFWGCSEFPRCKAVQHIG